MKRLLLTPLVDNWSKLEGIEPIFMYYYETQLVILIIFVWLPCAFFTLTVAANKDCYVVPWFLGGLFFGPLALIAIAGMPDRRTRKYIRLMAEKLEAIEPDKE